MKPHFDPAEVAERWYSRWEESGWFKPAGDQPQGSKPFCIALPPPNVTGTLHMGHGFQVSLMDALIRYHRMLGEDVLWQGGTDHAGIATQMVVERQLEEQQIARASLGREEFVERVWAWKQESGDIITRQLRRLGASIDWSRERFTMDEHFSQAVLEVFVKLSDKGLIYRDKRLVNWDPEMLTALSDLEVVAEEEEGSMYQVRYPFVDDEGEGIVIATTRPETILVDGAIAVHPEDSRFSALLGKKVWVPMTEPRRAIEIIADEHVDPEFGTGCVKITPAHDFNDYDLWRRHADKDIPMLVLMSPDATLNDNAPQAYRGLDRYRARERIVADLQEAGLLLKVEPHRYKLPRGDRSGAVLEPMLNEQWFMDMRALADRALQAVDNGDTRFVPEQWRNTFNAWLGDIQDWCISRQLWWGHQIPAWYDSQGRVWVAHSEAEAAAKAKSATGADVGPLRRDESVLDTWFSSALWSFVPLGWPQDADKNMQRWHPTQVLVTGFDIIFFWVARMMMMSLELLDQVPFHDVFVHGLVLDKRGQKMSKSKGNILDPIDLIDGIGIDDLVAKRTTGLMQPKMRQAVERQTRKDFPKGLDACGADALRFTFCALATTGRNVHFDTNQIEGYRNFCNKLWNAARFVFRRLEGRAQPDQPLQLDAEQLGLAERWILSRLQDTTAAVHRGLQSYRLDLASQALYDFIWHQYCDWYLECAKTQLDDEDARDASEQTILAVMVQVLEQLLRLAHPFMPFITEELWQKAAPFAVADPGETIMLSAYPEADKTLIDAEAEADFGFLSNLIGEVRNLRGEAGIHPAATLEAIIAKEGSREAALLRRHAALFGKLAGTSQPRTLAPGEQPPTPHTSLLAGETQLLIPLRDLIDIEQERQRLSKAIAQTEGRIKGYNAKLNNADFCARAPQDIVEGTKKQLAEAENHLQQLKRQHRALGTA